MALASRTRMNLIYYTDLRIFSLALKLHATIAEAVDAAKPTA